MSARACPTGNTRRDFQVVGTGHTLLSLVLTGAPGSKSVLQINKERFKEGTRTGQRTCHTCIRVYGHYVPTETPASKDALFRRHCYTRQVIFYGHDTAPLPTHPRVCLYTHACFRLSMGHTPHAHSHMQCRVPLSPEMVSSFPVFPGQLLANALVAQSWPGASTSGSLPSLSTATDLVSHCRL